MAKKPKVNMHLDHVMIRVKDATDEVLHALALQVEGTTKMHIVLNDQIDTGFMLNSVYAESSKGSTYDETWPGGVDNKAPRLRLPKRFSVAAVHVSAAYAIYQEMQNSFLRVAAREVASMAGGISKPIWKRALHD